MRECSLSSSLPWPLQWSPSAFYTSAEPTAAASDAPSAPPPTYASVYGKPRASGAPRGSPAHTDAATSAAAAAGGGGGGASTTPTDGVVQEQGQGHGGYVSDELDDMLEASAAQAGAHSSSSSRSAASTSVGVRRRLGVRPLSRAHTSPPEATAAQPGSGTPTGTHAFSRSRTVPISGDKRPRVAASPMEPTPRPRGPLTFGAASSAQRQAKGRFTARAASGAKRQRSMFGTVHRGNRIGGGVPPPHASPAAVSGGQASVSTVCAAATRKAQALRGAVAARPHAVTSPPSRHSVYGRAPTHSPAKTVSHGNRMHTATALLHRSPGLASATSYDGDCSSADGSPAKPGAFSSAMLTARPPPAPTPPGARITRDVVFKWIQASANPVSDAELHAWASTCAVGSVLSCVPRPMVTCVCVCVCVCVCMCVCVCATGLPCRQDVQWHCTGICGRCYTRPA